MDKLNKLAMPDVKSGTPQEKMNAVKKALQSLEMMTEAYNQIVPVINAKIDWLEQAEKSIKIDMPEQYDDTKLRKELDKKIDEIAKRQDDLARAQNAMDKTVKSIEIPKVPSVEPLRKRIKALENKPEIPKINQYDDSALLSKLSSIEKAIESLDKRLEFVRRTYSEKWETMQFTKASDNKELNDKLSEFESDISELKKSFNEIFE